MIISGSVTDVKSGKVIDLFKVMPVKAFRPDFYSTDFQESRVAIGKNGKYEMQIQSQGATTDRFRVRIEADGYRTAFGSHSMAAGEPPLVEDFRLEPIAALVGRVIAVDGTPASKFHVVIGTATTSPQFDFERPDNFFGQAFEVDGDVSFKIAASFEPQRLRVFNEGGFAELVVQPEQVEIGKVVLQPYAKVSGRLMQGEVPIRNEYVYFHPLVKRGLTEARFQDSFYARTDPDGYFDFKRLPPMAGCVHASLGPWQDSSLTSSQSMPLDLHSGDHKQIVLSGNGFPVSGRVIAVGRTDDKFSKQWSLNWLVSRNEGTHLPSDATPLSVPSKSGPIESSWLKHTDFSAWLATKDNHYVKFREDGTFKIHGVPEGEYDLVIQLYDQPAGCLIEAVGTRLVPVTVKAEQLSEFDIGTIEVECRTGPRPGSDMRAYKFVNSDGRVVYVDDLSGSYLLFHVWASWCAPCLASMPQLKSDIADMKQVPFTAIGINVDSDKKHGQTVASNLGLTWAQNYVGENSDLARQLAVSSVPAYYLIGPDGKLIGSSSEWKEIRQILQAKLQR